MRSLALSRLWLTAILAMVVSMAVLVSCDEVDTSTPTLTPTPLPTHTVSMLIEVSPDDARWFRDVEIPQGYDAYQLTEQVTAGELEATWYPSLRAHFVESIIGVANEGDSFWIIFLWDEFNEEWSPLMVGSDWFSVKDGHTLAWNYVDTTQQPSHPPSQLP